MRAVTFVLTSRHPALLLTGIGLILIGAGIGVRPR